ncbi:MAG: C25 family cysteine peptidase [bacterium]|nr:C25 family cysteine peptidase [bacterium]
MPRRLLVRVLSGTLLLLAGHSAVEADVDGPFPARWVAGQAAGPALTWDLLAEDAAGLTLRLDIHWVDLRAGEAGASFHIPGEGWSGGPGDPDLPALSRLLAAPGDAAAELQVLDLATVSRFDLRPLPRPAPRSEHPEALPEAAGVLSAVHAEGQAWPPHWVLAGESHLWLGQRVQALDVHPLRWHPREDRLELLQSLTVRIAWQRGRLPAPAPRPNFPEAERLLRGRTLNPDSPWLERADRMGGDGRPGSYLVVAPDAALPYLAEWILWKRRQGHEVRVLAESAIGGQETSTAQLRAAIQAEFSAAPFEYLLLVGDTDRYPDSTELSWNLATDFVAGGQYAESGWAGRCGGSYCIATDHPFSLQEGSDYFADLLVGRWSVDTANDLAKIVRRSVDYEAAPFLDFGPDWLQRGLMIYDVADAASRRETKLAIRDLLEQELGYTQVDTIRNHYWDAPVSPELVRQRVNNGVGIINYRGYGFRHQWYGPTFGTSHVATLNNVGRWPLVCSIVCGGGDFASVGTDPSFGEAWLRAGSNPSEPTGAIGFIGPTELDTHTEWNNAIDEGIFNGLARQGLRSLGALLDAGKLELWRAYPNARNWGQPTYSVPFYFHAYNLQGDPGLQLRTAPPRALACQTPDTLATGLAGWELEVAAADGHPLEELRGCLHHEELDLALTARADEAGRLRFAMDHLAEGLPAGVWTLTLWGEDLLPLQRTLIAAVRPSLLRLLTWSVAEEVEDGLFRPGEWLALRPRLVENGSAGWPETRLLELATPAGGLEILGAGAPIGPTAPGQVLEPLAGLEFRLEEGTPFGESLPIDLRLDGQLLGRVAVLPSRPSFQLTALEVVEGSLEPGATGQLRLQLRGQGLPFAGTLRARLGCFHDAVGVTADSALLIAPAPDSSAWVEGFQVVVDAAARRGSLATFELGLWPEGPGRMVELLHGQLPLGDLRLVDPVGPDAGGYLAIHSGDEHEQAPLHIWESISATGQELAVADWSDPWTDNPDGVSRVLPLPFPFRYYGEEFTEATVCTNGWLALGDQAHLYTALNTPIPAAQGPSAMIAPFWTDLVNSNGGAQLFGRLYHEARPEEGLFIVEWNHFRPVGSSSNLDFQLVLRDPALWPTANGNGEILVHYRDIALVSDHNGVTVGIEAPDEQSGLLYGCNNQWAAGAQPLADGHSLLFTPAVLDQNTVAAPHPASPLLLGVHPNPFNPVTRLSLELPVAAQIRWRLSNLRGQTVREQAWEARPAGRLEAVIDGARLASGVYLLEAEWRAGGQGGRVAEKLLLLR